MNGEHSNAPAPLSTDRQLKMDPELKDRWLEALRSGEYVQTTETLRDSGGFCCLGVLCDVVNPNGWQGDGNWKRDNDDPEEHSSINDLSSSMSHYVGIGGFKEGELVAMNDAGTKFPDIADWIEANV